MKSSKNITIIFLIISIFAFMISVQSKSIRHKRWTFNSWRLHGHKYPSYTSLGSEIDSSPPISPQEKDQFDQTFEIDNYNDEHEDKQENENKSYTILSRFLNLLHMLDRAEKESNNGLKYF